MFYYTIRPGDTIYKLVAQFNTPINAILSMNPGLNPYNLFVGQRIMIPTVNGEAAQNPQNANPRISMKEINLRNTLRRLWTDHVDFTRMVINAIASDSSELNSIVDRLSRNASDMAAALSPYYGEANSARFNSLFHDHLSITSQWIRALKEGNSQAAQNVEKQAYANADQIAEFLGMLNPYLPKDELSRMLYAHLALIKAETVSRLNHDYAKTIAIYDQMKDQASTIADMMASGIAKQFPNMFQ